MLAILHDDPVVSEPINQPTISESGDGRLATNEPVIVIQKVVVNGMLD